MADTMRIIVTEPTGIRHEGLGHLKQGEVREVPAALGLFFVSNGWADDEAEVVETGERGSLDLENPHNWAAKNQSAPDDTEAVPKARKDIKPKSGKHHK